MTQLTMKIAIIQTNPNSDFKKNLQKSIEYFHLAIQKGANVILYPETFLFMGSDSERKKFGQKMDEGAFGTFQELAKESKVHIIAGSIDEISEAKFYNTCATFSEIGEKISIYRKLHLFNLFDEHGNPMYCESNIYKSGDAPVPYKMTVNNETWNALNIICYDIRFPEIIRHLHTSLDVIFVPAAFTWQTGNDHWEVLLRARAIENQCYVVSCNQTGFSHGGEKRTYGNSMVIDPWGKVVVRLGEEEGILFCEISKFEIAKSRAKLPALKDRKIL